MKDPRQAHAKAARQRRRGRDAVALKTVEKGISHWPEDAELRIELATLVSLSDPARCLRELELAVSASEPGTDRHDAILLRASILSWWIDQDASRRYFAAIASAPSMGQAAYANHASLMAAYDGDSSKADACLMRAVELEPTNDDFAANLVEWLGRTDRKDEALAVAKRAQETVEGGQVLAAAVSRLPGGEL